MAGITAENVCSPSSCCLCRCTLEGAKGGRRHKKLRGNSCTTKRTVWERFDMECDCFNAVQQAFSNDSAILCYSCIGKANKFSRSRLTPINNRQNLSIFQNKIGLGS